MLSSGKTTHPGTIRTLGKQFLKGVSCDRIAQMRSNFLEGNQDKLPARPVRMRNFQLGLIDNLSIIQNDININIAGTLIFFSNALHFRFNLLAGAEQRKRIKPGCHLTDKIQEVGLIGHIHRLGFIKGGEPAQQNPLMLELLQRLGQMGFPVTQIGSE